MTAGTPTGLQDGSLARSVAERYVERIQAGDIEGVVSLYAEDAVVAHANPAVDPPVVVGRDALRTFYAGIVDRRPEMGKLIFHSAGPMCVLQFEGHLIGEGRPLEMIDVFVLDDTGHVARMDAYTRGREGVRGGTI